MKTKNMWTYLSLFLSLRAPIILSQKNGLDRVIVTGELYDMGGLDDITNAPAIILGTK